MNDKILYPLIQSMPGHSPQHSSYMLANQKNEQHSQLINLKGGGGGNILAPQIRTLYTPIEGKGQTPTDTAIKLANLQLQSTANRQYDIGVFKGGEKHSPRYKSNKRTKPNVKKTKQKKMKKTKKRKQLKNKNKTKNKKIY